MSLRRNSTITGTESYWVYNPFDEFYHDPKQRNTSVMLKRFPERKLFSTNGEYLSYTRRPLSETALEVPKGHRILWESSARELASSSTLLPSYPLHYVECYPEDAERIIRTKYLGRNRSEASWYFNANYSKENITVKFIIREINLIGIQRYEERDQASIELVKELYVLHYLQHRNLLHALFTQAEPKIYRMNIAFLRTAKLSDLATMFQLINTNEKCPSISYVSVCLLRALSYLHSGNIIHQNVSLQNVVVDERGNVMLGEFKNVKFVEGGKKREGKGGDIFGLGITVLDYLFGNRGFAKAFPDLSCIDEHESLFQKMYHFQPTPEDILDENERNFYRAQQYILVSLQPRALMWTFFDATTQNINNLPSANWLLDNHPFLDLNQEQFNNARREFVDKIADYDVVIRPLYNERKVTNKWQSVNSRRISNAFNRPPKPLEGHIPKSEFENENDYVNRIQFKTNSTIYISFILYCDFYDPPPRVEKEFIVGDEFSMFKMLCEVIQLRQKDYKGHINSTKNVIWHFINDPGQLFFPWDVFRLRTALQFMQSETHTFIYDPQTNIITKRRSFTLCKHKSKLTRRVEIQMKASRNDLINSDDIEVNEYIRTGRMDGII